MPGTVDRSHEPKLALGSVERTSGERQEPLYAALREGECDSAGNVRDQPQSIDDTAGT